MTKPTINQVYVKTYEYVPLDVRMVELSIKIPSGATVSKDFSVIAAIQVSRSALYIYKLDLATTFEKRKMCTIPKLVASTRMIVVTHVYF